MNFTQLKSFHAVATAGGFTKAGKLLGLSQPAITIQVRALEEAYGVSLFHRNSQGVSLTDLGHKLHGVTSRIFGLIDEAEDIVAAEAALTDGHLKVGADGPYFVMDLLAAFTARYPGVRVTADMGNTETLLEQLSDYRTDVAMLTAVVLDPAYYAIPYGFQTAVVFVHRDHEWAGRKSIKLGDLDRQPMILREPPSITRRVLESALEGTDITPRVVMELGSREAVREAVAAGLGIGVVFEAELGRDDRLCSLAVADRDLGCWEYAVCLKERRNLRMVQAFLDLAVEMSPAMADDAATTARRAAGRAS
ncbi:MAG: LysR family transcriptional regulator [Proteobacteria bacterium]|nr:LysR family transcriptional regulator [Pseudomonadota bacterium]